jgi:hypothetical protein
MVVVVVVTAVLVLGSASASAFHGAWRHFVFYTGLSPSGYHRSQQRLIYQNNRQQREN